MLSADAGVNLYRLMTIVEKKLPNSCRILRPLKKGYRIRVEFCDR